MIKRSFLFIALLLWSRSKGFGQQKFEKEYRINSEDVPSAAINFIQKITDKKRLKWVAEESHDGKTIEAKFYKNSRKYSVEFDKQGQLIDIEILISVSNLPASEKVLLEKTLGNEFAKFSILKIQKQFKNITFDHRWGMGVVIPKSDIGLEDFIFCAEGLNVIQELVFTHRWS